MVVVLEELRALHPLRAAPWKYLRASGGIILTVFLAVLGWHWAYRSSLVYVAVTEPVAGQAFAEVLRVSVSQFHRIAECRVELRRPDDSVVAQATGLSVEWPVEGIDDGDYLLVVTPLVRWPWLRLGFTISSQVVAVPVAVSKRAPIIEVYGVAEREYLTGSRDVTLKVSGGTLEAVSIGGIPKAIPRDTSDATIPLDVSTWEDGEYDIGVVARSRSGLTADRSVKFRVDTTPPQIETIALEREHLRGEVALAAKLRHAEEVEAVWLVNGATIGSGLSLTWDTCSVDDGKYRLELRVTDGARNSDSEGIDVFVMNDPPNVQVAPEVTLRRYFRFSAVPLRVKAEGARIISVEAGGVRATPGSEEGLYWLVLRHFQHGETVKVVATAINEAGTPGTGEYELEVSSCALLSSFTYNPHKLASLLYVVLLTWFFI